MDTKTIADALTEVTDISISVDVDKDGNPCVTCTHAFSEDEQAHFGVSASFEHEVIIDDAAVKRAVQLLVRDEAHFARFEVLQAAIAKKSVDAGAVAAVADAAVAIEVTP